MKKLFVFLTLVIFILTFAYVDKGNRAEASAKKEGGHASAKEEKKEEPQEEVEEDTFDDSKSDVKHAEDQAKEEKTEEAEASGHGEKKAEEPAKEEAESGGHGKKEKAAAHGEEEGKEEKPKAVEAGQQYNFYDSVQSLAELMEEESPTEEKVKIVYRVPSSCSEFSLYLETKQKNLERLEKELEHKKAMITKLKEEFDRAVQKYGDLEKRIQNLMRTGDGKFANNPELAKMVKLYESISPEEAAERLKNLDLDLTLALLKGMSPKKLSLVMIALDPKISAALSSRMVRGF